MTEGQSDIIARTEGCPDIHMDGRKEGSVHNIPITVQKIKIQMGINI